MGYGLKQIEVGDQISVDAKMFCSFNDIEIEDLKVGLEIEAKTMIGEIYYRVCQITYEEDNEIKDMVLKVLSRKE